MRGGAGWGMEGVLQAWYREGRGGASRRKESHLAELCIDRGVCSFTNKGWSRIVGLWNFRWEVGG